MIWKYNINLLTGGCSAFGHSCFGGHGKRFDPNIQEKMLQDDDTITNNRHREIEDLNSRNEFDVSEKKFGGQTEILSSQNRHQDSSRFNPFALSFIVRQWVYLNCISSKKKK